MNRPPITPRRLLFAFAVLLLISSQLPAPVATFVSHVPRSFVALLISPSTVMLRRLSVTLRPSRQNRSDSADAGDLAEQLAQARAYIDNLEQEVRELRSVNESLDQTRRFLDLGDIRMVGGNVTAFNGDRNNPVITIDLGTDDGVRKGLAVVWRASLVGEVVQASARTADVRLIIATGMKLQVRINKPNAVGAVPLPAFIELADDGRTFFTDEFALDAPVQVGDLVHLADDRWQFRARGFIVGQVIKAEPHPDRPLLNKRVQIQPTLPLTSLTRATVLVPVD